jgi:hypothetical protein
VRYFEYTRAQMDYAIDGSSPLSAVFFAVLVLVGPIFSLKLFIAGPHFLSRMPSACHAGASMARLACRPKQGKYAVA